MSDHRFFGRSRTHLHNARRSLACGVRSLHLEPLEGRHLLSTVGLLAEDLNSPDDAHGDVVRLTLAEESFFAAKTSPLAKLGSTLGTTFGEYVSHSARAEGRGFQPSNSLVQISEGMVQINAAASADTAALLADLESLGLKGGSTYGVRVSGRLPLDAVDEMAALESVQFASAALRPWTNVGLTDSQGDAAMNADDARSLFGVDGSGVTIGVLSNSFDTSGTGSYATDVASGDLPAGINVLADYSSSTDEGRGMMQLIHDVAPGADLAFHTAYSSEVDFANGILALADAGADVIVDDVMYLEEPMFQDGIVAQAVDAVVANSVAYFSSAGNSARKSYESAFVASGESLEVDGEPRGMLHDFDPGPEVDYLQSIYIPFFSTIYIAFQWDEPFYSVSGAPGAAKDLDVYITNEDGTGVYAQSITRNIGGDPVEVIQYTGMDLFGQHNIMIANYDGLDAGLMKYVVYDAGFSPSILNEYDTASSTTFGHANAAGAEAVGAAFYGDTPAFGQNPPLLESFSSAGGTPILFDTAGNRLATPEIREKVEIVAPDGTNTTFFPAGNDTDGDGFPNFYGTSAASPHAAAVAALMLEMNPSLTPAEIYSTLESTAIDMDVAGFDNNTGYGLIQADLALAAVPSDPRLSVLIADAEISENGGSTSATVTRWNTDNSSPLDVTLTNSDTSEATVPGMVTIPAGQSSIDFTITGVDDDLLDGVQTVTITAAAGGLLEGSDTVRVNDDEPQFLSQWASTVINFSSEWYDPYNPIPNAWGSVQTLGPPDTPQYGDYETTWAAATPDGNGVEYITLGYDTPVFATGGTVRETYGNGFVTQLEVREAGTDDFEPVWWGTDPSLPGTPVDFEVSWSQTTFLVDALRVTTNSYHNSDINGAGEGWENIDAVRLDGWDQQPPPTVTVTIAATDASAAENPLDGGLFTISRSDTAGNMTVFYAVDPGGTADSSDYLESLSGSVLIVDGQSSATIAITPVDDDEEEGDETLTLSLDAGAGYVVGSPDNATVTIADDDVVAPALQLVIVDASIVENAGAAATTATVTRNTDTANALLVTLTNSDTSEVGVPTSVTIEAGSTSAEFYIDAVDDDVADGTQTVTLTASAAGFSDGIDTIDVTDNETAMLTLVIATDSIAENAGPAATTATVFRNTETLNPLVVTLGSDDASEATVPATVIIPAGFGSASFNIDAVDDSEPDGTQTVTLTASAAGFSNGVDTIDVTDDDDPASPVLSVANADILVAGTVVGDFTDTQSDNTVYEQITERDSGGKPQNRYSYLEHKWTFDVTPGNAVIFYLQAYATNSDDGDDFEFAYSTDDSDFVHMLTVTRTSDDSFYQTSVLPGSTNGTVYVRVQDTDRSPGNRSKDTVFIDHMYIETVTGDVDFAPTVAIETPVEGGVVSESQLIAIAASDTEDPDDSLTVDWNVDGGGWQPAAYNSASGYYEATWVTTGVADGDYTIYARATDSAGNSTTDSVGVTVGEVVVGTMHVGDIDGSVNPKNKKWQALVTVLIHDDADSPLDNVAVVGAWSGSFTGTATGTSGPDGMVTFTTGLISSSDPVTFTVIDVTGSLEYSPGENHDGDDPEDSSGTAIIVDKDGTTTAPSVANIDKALVALFLDQSDGSRRDRGWNIVDNLRAVNRLMATYGL
jgi:subtilase family protein/Big-like domain-containing protein/Calx-beta domain-containing protein